MGGRACSVIEYHVVIIPCNYIAGEYSIVLFLQVSLRE